MFAWWDDFELWLTGLGFIFQFALVMVVLVPVAAGVAVLLDRLVTLAIARVRRGRDS